MGAVPSRGRGSGLDTGWGMTGRSVRNANSRELQSTIGPGSGPISERIEWITVEPCRAPREFWDNYGQCDPSRSLGLELRGGGVGAARIGPSAAEPRFGQWRRTFVQPAHYLWPNGAKRDISVVFRARDRNSRGWGELSPSQEMM